MVFINNEFFLQGVNFLTEEMRFSDVFFFFFIYSIGGWIIEESYSFAVEGKFKDDGFLLGPLKPMYGIAPMLLIYLLKFTNNIFIVLLISFIIPSMVEYISGYLLDKIFNKKYWDYSKNKINISGYVCLKFSVYWIFLSISLLYILHPKMESLYNNFQDKWLLIMPYVAIYFIFDFAYTIYKFARESFARA